MSSFNARRQASVLGGSKPPWSKEALPMFSRPRKGDILYAAYDKRGTLTTGVDKLICHQGALRFIFQFGLISQSSDKLWCPVVHFHIAVTSSVTLMYIIKLFVKRRDDFVRLFNHKSAARPWQNTCNPKISGRKCSFSF